MTSDETGANHLQTDKDAFMKRERSQSTHKGKQGGDAIGRSSKTSKPQQKTWHARQRTDIDIASSQNLEDDLHEFADEEVSYVRSPSANNKSYKLMEALNGDAGEDSIVNEDA